MYCLILLFPLISFLQAFFGGAFFGRVLGSAFSVSLLCLSFFVSLGIFFEVSLSQTPVWIPFFSWVVYGLFSIDFGLIFDIVTATMLIVITVISFFVHLYSVEYMGHDPFILRFISYLSLFTFFMLFMVTSDNLVQLFMGWEGVGLCSYLLINFWFTRILANKAAIKAMLMNRIADVFFIFAVVLTLFYLGSCGFFTAFLLKDFSLHFYVGSSVFVFTDLLCLFLFVGAIGKSAQLGFHTWLPDAMEGPTPVSSLLHAATMVTAGVFLILRCSPFFEDSSFFLSLAALFGGVTAFFSAFIALFQWDLKKVVAYSTCSQLGYMFLAAGFSCYSLTLFHLFNHAFFKALLFLSSGVVIHALADEQDMRRMGALGNALPFTLSSMLFASLAIMGFPFLAGFYSKDIIFEFLLASFKISSIFLYTLLLLSAFFTASYSFRLIRYVFLGSRLNSSPVSLPTESLGLISFTLFFLVVASTVAGYVFSDFFIGLGASNPLDSSYPLEDSLVSTSLIAPWQRNLPFYVSIFGFILSTTGIFIWCFVIPRLGLLRLSRIFAIFFYQSGFFNRIYNSAYNSLYLKSYGSFTKLMDKGFLEFFGPVGFYRFTTYLSLQIRAWPNLIFFQIGTMFFAVVVWFILMFFFSSCFPGILALISIVILLEFRRS